MCVLSPTLYLQTCDGQIGPVCSGPRAKPVFTDRSSARVLQGETVDIREPAVPGWREIGHQRKRPAVGPGAHARGVMAARWNAAAEPTIRAGGLSGFAFYGRQLGCQSEICPSSVVSLTSLVPSALTTQMSPSAGSVPPLVNTIWEPSGDHAANQSNAG